MNAVQDFEREFASFVGAKHAIAMSNGTVTLEVALRALGVKPGDRVATTPLTHSATTIAILNVGAIPAYVDVDPDTWIMQDGGPDADWWMPVALYGLWGRLAAPGVIEDAAQTLRQHDGAAFTSYSFQASKILALGEGGMLVTNSKELATAARSISSLGYDLSPDSPRISKDAIKDPRAIRHVRYPSVNARMNEITAREGLACLKEGNAWPAASGGFVNAPSRAELAKLHRQASASFYREAVAGCEWVTPQKAPDGWQHDYWAFAFAVDSPGQWLPLADAIVRHGGTKPFSAWRLTFSEPAFAHLDPGPDACPVARSLQPRVVACQTNNLADAERNALALRRAIQEVGG